MNIPFDPYDFFGYLAAGLLVLIGSQVLFGFPHIIDTEMKITDVRGIGTVLMAYIAGQIVAGPSRLVLQTLIVGKILKRPSVNLLRKKRPWVRWVLFPGYVEPLPAPIIDRVMKKAREAQVTEVGEAMFQRIRFDHETLANERLTKKLDGIVNKYGFCRNLAFTSLLLGVAFLVKNWIAPSPELLKYGLAALVGGVLLFYRYLTFFRQYSYELFNAFAGRK